MGATLARCFAAKTIPVLIANSRGAETLGELTADSVATVAALAESLGLAAIEVGKIAEGGRLMQARAPLVFQNLIKYPMLAVRDAPVSSGIPRGGRACDAAKSSPAINVQSWSTTAVVTSANGSDGRESRRHATLTVWIHPAAPAMPPPHVSAPDGNGASRSRIHARMSPIGVGRSLSRSSR